MRSRVSWHGRTREKAGIVTNTVLLVLNQFQQCHSVVFTVASIPRAGRNAKQELTKACEKE